jgi:hypothetical protein
MQRTQLGNEHPDVATSLNSLAMVLARRSDLNGAEALAREALSMRRKSLGQGGACFSG